MYIIKYFFRTFCSCRPIKLPGIQKAVNKHGGKGKTVGVRGGKTRLTRSSGKNVEPLESKPDILEDDKEESKQEKNNEMKEKEEVDKK